MPSVESQQSGTDPKPRRAPKPPAELAHRPFDSDMEYVEMERKQLVEAPYNPRIMGEAEKRKLRGILKKHGLKSAPVWNKRTGRIVSGHQRLSQADSIHGSPNYTLMVGVIDVDETTEKELNIAFNNPNAQGDWDLELLDGMLKDGALSLAGAGFDQADVFRLFGDMPGAAQPEVEELAKKLREKVSNNTGRDDFYLIVVFKDDAERDGFTNGCGLPPNRYQDGKQLFDILKGIVPPLTQPLPAEGAA